jgi:hypothetical protein
MEKQHIVFVESQHQRELEEFLLDGRGHLLIIWQFFGQFLPRTGFLRHSVRKTCALDINTSLRYYWEYCFVQGKQKYSDNKTCHTSYVKSLCRMNW